MVVSFGVPAVSSRGRASVQLRSLLGAVAIALTSTVVGAGEGRHDGQRAAPGGYSLVVEELEAKNRLAKPAGK